MTITRVQGAAESDFVSSKHNRELAEVQGRPAREPVRFRNIIEKNADGVVVLNWEGIVLYMNAAAEKLFGCRVADCQGTLLGIPIVPDERTEVDIPQRSGQILIAEMRCNRNGMERAAGPAGFLRNVTDRERQEDALREADRRKDEFLAMLGHGLRNPLTPIENAAQVFRLLGPARRDLRSARERSIARCGTCRGSLTTCSTSPHPRGKVHLQRAKVDVAATMLHQAIETSQPIISAQRAHELTTSIPAAPVLSRGCAGGLAQNRCELAHQRGQIHPGRHGFKRNRARRSVNH